MARTSTFFPWWVKVSNLLGVIMNRTQILAAAFTLLAVSAPISEAAELVHSSAGSTFSNGTRSRGYWFAAPVTFIIDALRVPNVGGGGTQNLQIMTLPSAPPSWSSTSMR